MKTLHGYPLIDDDFGPADHGPEHGTGYTGRDYSQYPLNGQSFNAPPSIQRLSEKEIVERVIEKNAKNNWIVDIAERAGVGPKNQKQSSYCWIHAPVQAMELMHAHAGGPKQILSAFYPGSQIKHGANQGGSGIEGMKWLSAHGTCLESEWPIMQFHGTVTPEIKASADRHKITLACEIPRDDYQMIYSYLVQDFPVPVGSPAWSHEICFVAAVFKSGNDYGQLRPRFRNSWGADWGTRGCGILDGAKLRLDEACAIEQMSQSAN